MLWCVISLALVCGGLGLMVLMVPPARLRLPTLRAPRVTAPAVLRGCLALSLLLLALLLGGIALLLQ